MGTDGRHVAPSRTCMLHRMRPSKTIFLTLIAAPTLLACTACSTAPERSGAEVSASEELAELQQGARRLERLMPGPQVEEMLGPPTTNEPTTCGQGTGQPWPCRLWRYETTAAARDLHPVLAVYLRCELVRRLDVLRALHRQGVVTDDELAALRRDPRAAERIELCVVNSWRWL